MTTALLFLRKYYKQLAVVLVLLGVWFYWHSLTSKIEDQRVENARLVAVNEVLEESNRNLTTAIEQTNVTIRKIGEGADQTKEDFAALNSTVKGQIAALNPKLNAILNGAKPMSCPDTVKYLLDARKDYPR